MARVVPVNRIVLPAIEVAGTSSQFPIALASDDRSFQTATGVRWFMHCEAAWSAIIQLTDSEWATYLDDRQSRGFNCILVNLIEHNFGDAAPNMIAGGGGYAPFSTANDIRTPVENYFNRAKTFVDMCAVRGMAVLLCPAYYGYNAGSEGWYSSAIATRTTGEVQDYGEYVGAKFAGCSNIIWLMYGDGYQSGAVTRYDALATGIKVYHSGLMTGHLAPESFTAQSVVASWLDFNYVYSYGLNNLRGFMASAYADTPAIPGIMGETWYEGYQAGGPQTRVQIRQQCWLALCSGMAGDIFGNAPIWSFESDGANPGTGTWESNLNSSGSQDRAIFHAFVDSNSIGALIPDGGAILTGGVGTGESTALCGADALTGATLAVAYTPSQKALTIDWSKFAGSVTATWVSATSGSEAAATGSPFTNSGSSAITPPSSGDWALLLEA